MMGGVFSTMVLPSASSNHWLISLEWKRIGVNLQRPFRFEKLWLLHPDFLEKVQQWWQELTPIIRKLMYQFQQKLKCLKGKINNWNSKSFGNIFQERKQLDHKMKEVQQAVMTQGFSEELRAQEHHILKGLNLKEQQEEIIWKKK